jgi:hypothetical protein
MEESKSGSAAVSLRLLPLTTSHHRTHHRMKRSSTTYTVVCALAGPGSYDVSADFAPFAPGSWTFNCTSPPYRLDWKEVTTTIEISGGSWSCRRSDGYCAGTVQLVAGQFPPTATGYQAVTPNQHYHELRGITFSAELKVVKTLQLPGSLSTPLGERFAARTIGEPYLW